MADVFINLAITCHPDLSEVLIAELAEIGFDSFVELEKGFEASVPQSDFDEPLIRKILGYYSSPARIEYTLTTVKSENWNREWEKNYDPVTIGESCMIRADFHDIQSVYPIDIIINPKMSFGTGHHATTFMMIEHLLHEDINGWSVLDAGCGTGILSIVSSKKGASSIIAFDNDLNACNNARENIRKNGCSNIEVIYGSVDTLDKIRKFQMILANINRNTILEQTGDYSEKMTRNGKLILSGFLPEDNGMLIRQAESQGLRLQNQNTMNNWSSLVFHKKSK